MRSRLAAAVVLLALAAAALTSAEGRNPAIRVSVRAGLRATDGKAEPILDVQEILRGQKQDSVLAYAEAGEPADLALWITRRYTKSSAQGGVRQGTTSFRCVIQGIVFDDDRRIPVSGASVGWQDAATKLVDALADYAEQRQHELLRKRTDWPELAFEFETLTKERKKLLGARDGGIILTAVRPDGPAQTAGLLEGDVILGLAGRKLRTTAELARALYAGPPGAEVRLDVLHEGARRTVMLVIP